MSTHDVVITGIGLVSSLGEGADAHWAGASTARPRAGASIANASRPIPSIRCRRSTGTSRSPSAATSGRWKPGSGSAPIQPAWRCDDAGIKGDEALCATMDMVVAAGGGERDEAVDAAHPRRRREPQRSRRAAQREADDRTAPDACSWRSFPTCLPATSPSSTR